MATPPRTHDVRAPAIRLRPHHHQQRGRQDDEALTPHLRGKPCVLRRVGLVAPVSDNAFPLLKTSQTLFSKRTTKSTGRFHRRKGAGGYYSSLLNLCGAKGCVCAKYECLYARHKSRGRAQPQAERGLRTRGSLRGERHPTSHQVQRVD